MHLESFWFLLLGEGISEEGARSHEEVRVAASLAAAARNGDVSELLFSHHLRERRRLRKKMAALVISLLEEMKMKWEYD